MFIVYLFIYHLSSIIYHLSIFLYIYLSKYYTYIYLSIYLGQFGTRLAGGKDSASPRYIFTQLSPLAR